MAVNSAVITEMLNATLKSLEGVLPRSIRAGRPILISAPVHQQQVGVLVGMTGDLYGRIVMLGEQAVFSGIGESMYGMQLDGEMLHSFAGELGNMVAGNAATNAAGSGVTIDITPPTVMIGDVRLYGFGKGVSVPVEIETIGTLNLVLILDEKNQSAA